MLGCAWISGLSACGPSPMVDACPRTCLPTYTWPAALPGSPTACANRAGCRAVLHEGGAEPFKAARGEEGSATPRDTTAHNATVPTPPGPKSLREREKPDSGWSPGPAVAHPRHRAPCTTSVQGGSNSPKESRARPPPQLLSTRSHAGGVVRD